MVIKWDNGYLQPSENLTKEQERALEKILKKEEEIEKVQDEISKILIENDLNILDVDKYKRSKTREEVGKLLFPKPKNPDKK